MELYTDRVEHLNDIQYERSGISKGDREKREKGRRARERERTRAGRGGDCERHATIAAIDRVIETRYAAYGQGQVGYRSTLRMDMIP